jgi:hypothetical protein
MFWIICKLERFASLQWGGWVCWVLCIFMRPFMVGEDGFRFCLLPTEVLRNKYLARIYEFADMILENFCWVYFGGLEFVSIQEILYFDFVLLDAENDYTVAFVRFRYHCVIVLKFCFY